MNESVLDNLLGAFENLGGEDVVLTKKDSSLVDLRMLLSDHVYGLLSKESLSDKEAMLLASMLQSRLLTP